MFEALMTLFALYSAWCFCSHRLLHYLRYLQQDEYRKRRFLRWFFLSRAFDKKASFAALVCAGAAYAGYPIFSATAGSCFLLTLRKMEGDPRKSGKLPLKMTSRAQRTYSLTKKILMAFLILAFCMAAGQVELFWLGLILIVQLLPFLLVAGEKAAWSQEQALQNNLKQEAKLLWKSVSPCTVGVTGSYGKSSVKNALGEILRITLGPAFWPPKGINTEMGIIREIRECLKPGCRYAVIEMGAYQRGTIRNLCELTPPQAAIITAAGVAHLERFKSPQEIYRAKSELAQAVPYEGILVCNGDDRGARKMAQEFSKRTTLLYGFEQDQGELDCWITSFETLPAGSRFSVLWKGKKYEGTTPLQGRLAVSNAVAAFTMACALGANPETVIAAIGNLQPLENRLQVQLVDEVTYIHDAYNSNPRGFEAALELLEKMPGERRILMTPGMIELGDRQMEENTRVAKRAAQACDLALIVGNTNRTALSTGLKDGGLSDREIIYCETREIAFHLFNQMKKRGDIILIENDLTDLLAEKPNY